MNYRLILIGFFSVFHCTISLPIAHADDFEPPRNPYLADSPWPMTHRNPYAQGSSPLHGPTRARDLRGPDFVFGGVSNITLAMSPVYPNGGRVYWGSSFGSVYKLNAGGIGLIKYDQVKKPSGEGPLKRLARGPNGVYILVDSNNTLYTVEADELLAYSDVRPRRKSSSIQLSGRYRIPGDALRVDDDSIVGLSMTYDGFLAFATKWGTVGVIDRGLNDSHFHYVQLGDETEEVSNSIAVDEDGGIYVVTSKKMYRVQWTGSELTLDDEKGAWSATYEAGPDNPPPPRLGPGSGTTPSLMGRGGDLDKFVVILDGQVLSHLVLFWRDEIPEDWQPIAPGKDRRIAAEVPVDFGVPEATQSLSEQSVLVRGYGAVVVNNLYRNTDRLPTSSGYELIDELLGQVPVVFSHLPAIQPWGVHKMEWNPTTKRLETAWVNNDVSCPNGIPTMSAASNMFYCYGARFSSWTIEAVDWSEGDRVFTKYLGFNPLYNSHYAALQVVENGALISGTSFGIVELDPR